MADDHLFHAGDDWHEGVSAGILGAAQPVPHRVGRGSLDRADQLLRQPGRVRSARRSWASVKQATGSYRYGLWFLSASVILSALIIASLGIGKADHTRAETAPGTRPRSRDRAG